MENRLPHDQHLIFSGATSTMIALIVEVALTLGVLSVVVVVFLAVVVVFVVVVVVVDVFVVVVVLLVVAFVVVDVLLVVFVVVVVLNVVAFVVVVVLNVVAFVVVVVLLVVVFVVVVVILVVVEVVLDDVGDILLVVVVMGPFVIDEIDVVGCSVVVILGHLCWLHLLLSLFPPGHFLPAPFCLMSSFRVLSFSPPSQDLVQSLQPLHWLQTQSTDSSVVVVVDVVVDVREVVFSSGHLCVLQLRDAVTSPIHLRPAPCCLVSSVRVLTDSPTLQDRLHSLHAPHSLNTQSTDTSVVIGALVDVVTGQL